MIDKNRLILISLFFFATMIFIIGFVGGESYKQQWEFEIVNERNLAFNFLRDTRLIVINEKNNADLEKKEFDYARICDFDYIFKKYSLYPYNFLRKDIECKPTKNSIFMSVNLLKNKQKYCFDTNTEEDMWWQQGKYDRNQIENKMIEMCN